jgi:hypothetical protein
MRSLPPKTKSFPVPDARLGWAWIACWLALHCAPTLLAGELFQATMRPEAVEAFCTQLHVAEVITKYDAHPDHFPDSGYLLLSIDAGSQLEKANIPAGSIFLSRGSYQFGLYLASDNHRSLEERGMAAVHDLLWVSPKGVPGVTPLEPGLMGGHFMTYRHLPRWYLHYGKRAAAWDHLVVGALLAQGKDVATAESCWAMAMAAGYKLDQLAYWAALMIGVATTDVAKTEAAMMLYGEPTPALRPGDFPLVSADWLAGAYLTGNVKRLVELTRAFAPVARDCFIQADELASLVAVAAAFPASGESPDQASKHLTAVPMLRKLTSGEAHDDLNLMYSLGAAVENTGDTVFKPVESKMQLGEHESGEFTLPAECQDAAVEIEFRGAGMVVPEGYTSRYDRRFEFEFIGQLKREVPDLIDSSTLMTTALSFGKEEIFPTRNLEVSGWGEVFNVPHSSWLNGRSKRVTAAPLVRPEFSFDSSQWHLLRMVRVGNQVESILDGKRLALLPAPSPVRALTFKMRVIGSHIFIRAFRLYHLQATPKSQ